MRILFAMKRFAQLVLVLITACAVHSVLWSPKFAFPEPVPFQGQVWHNPYEGLSPNQWKLANFQVQSDAWAGVTNGRNNPSDRVFEVYAQLGYDIITVSDYMSINPHRFEDRPHYPLYEHGYGAFKTHQLCLGARGVHALDYPLFQTRSNKQHILNALRSDCEAVAIAHPSLRGAYSHRDMALLTGFDLVEAVSRFKMSLSHWDAALSAGKPAFLVSNDDAHDLDNPYDYGRCATVIAVDEPAPEAVWSALKAGQAYGYVPFCPENVNHVNKRAKFAERPHLVSCEIQSDSLLVVEASRAIARVLWIGQASDTLGLQAFQQPVTTVSFPLADVQHYVRSELTLDNGDVFYLNPVFRTPSGAMPEPHQAILLPVTTWLGRLALLLVFIAAVFLRFEVRITLRLPQLPSLVRGA